MTLTETIDMYDTYMSSVRSVHADAASKVRFPIFPTNTLSGNDKESGMKNIGSFCLSNGGRFISDKDLVPDEMVSEILKLIATFVAYEPEKAAHQEQSDVGIYEHLPTMLLNFAYFSRIDSRYRLLDRCARHTCDLKAPSIYEQTAEFFECNDKKRRDSK